MKYNIFLVLGLGSLALSVLFAQPTQALSCLPVDMYLADVIGKDDVVIFSGKATSQTMETDYTSEVLAVTDVLQGSVESTVIVYHEKHAVWGYLCNAGPKAVGASGVYIAIRDDAGKYTITQRLESNDPLLTTMKSDLAKDDITGERVELTATDRTNQILTTITDLLREISLLIKEYRFWLTQK